MTRPRRLRRYGNEAIRWWMINIALMDASLTTKLAIAGNKICEDFSHCSVALKILKARLFLRKPSVYLSLNFLKSSRN